MENVVVNYFAIGAASLIGFVIGFIWYGPLFGKAWMEESGMTEEKARSGNMPKTFGITFILQIFMAYCLAMFLGDPSIDIGMATFYGFLTGLGWILPVMIINNLYEQRSMKLSFIQGGYWVVVFTLMGLVLGAWR